MSAYRYFGACVLLLLLIALGIAKYSRITPEQRRRLELESRLEQLYHLEQTYFQQHRRYFDPLDSALGVPLQWRESWAWESQAGPYSFWALVRADLDSDGEAGIWRVDEKSPQAQVLVED